MDDEDEKFYIDCEYCAESIHMDNYIDHLYDCRQLCKFTTSKVDYTPDYYEKIEREKLEQREILDGIIRERLIMENAHNWNYDAFESFIRRNQYINCDSGLVDPENKIYSQLVYIWSVTGHFSCDICMRDNYTIYRKMICSHKMCNSCYLEWFKMNTTCPFCRHDLREPLSS